jgi:hypothetical protein
MSLISDLIDSAKGEVTDFSKSQMYGEALRKIVGVTPSYKKEGGKTVVYYPEDKIPAARKSFNALMESPDGNVKVDFMPVITPYALKTYGVYALGLVALGFLVGKKM